MGSGMVDDFIERKHGRQKIEYLLPQLEEILKETYGIILYQEQVQKIAVVLANYNLGEADILRRAMGKKNADEMAKQKSRFLDGAASNQIDPKIADEIFELMAKFADYGFNKSHSAAYALICYQTAFLKAHFPEQFMAAIMTCDFDNTDKVIRYIEECRRMNIKMVAPSINQSYFEFKALPPKVILYGLGAIKGMGSAPIEMIVKEREEGGRFTSLTDFARRVNLAVVGKKTLELLAQAGAFDEWDVSRADVLHSLSEWVAYSREHHGAKSTGQGSLFGDDDGDESHNFTLKESPTRPTAFQELLTEKKILGVFLRTHPLSLYQHDLKFSKLALNKLDAHVGEKQIPLIAFLSDVSERMTKSGKRMVYLSLEDQTASQVAVMFEKEIPEDLPAADQVVYALANVSKNFDQTQIQLRIEKIMPLEDVRRRIKKASLILRSSLDDKARAQTDIAALRKLKELVDAYPGQTELSVSLELDGARVPIVDHKTMVDLCDSFYHNMKSLRFYAMDLTY
jgi:DNA polymerase-3 subunit alpha